MTQQFIRKVSLISGTDTEALDLSQLHFKFNIERGDLQTPNSADIRIYNVSDATAAKFLNAEFTKIVLQAGYEGNFGVIFAGTIAQARHGRESSVDTYLDITAIDGDGLYNYAVVNTTIAAGSTQNDHVNALVKSDKTQSTVAGFVEGLMTYALPRGKVMYGMARDYLRVIAQTSQTNWHIQNGELTIVPQNNFIPDEAQVINAATGMVGLPEQTQNGIRVRTLINPKIRIGATIQIDNKAVQLYRFGLSLNDATNNGFINKTIHLNKDGWYKVLWVNYSGNTRGNEWYSDITCIAIDAVLGLPQLQNKKSVSKTRTPPINVYG